MFSFSLSSHKRFSFDAHENISSPWKRLNERRGPENKRKAFSVFTSYMRRECWHINSGIVSSEKSHVHLMIEVNVIAYCQTVFSWFPVHSFLLSYGTKISLQVMLSASDSTEFHLISGISFENKPEMTNLCIFCNDTDNIIVGQVCHSHYIHMYSTAVYMYINFYRIRCRCLLNAIVSVCLCAAKFCCV